MSGFHPTLGTYVRHKQYPIHRGCVIECHRVMISSNVVGMTYTRIIHDIFSSFTIILTSYPASY